MRQRGDHIPYVPSEDRRSILEYRDFVEGNTVIQPSVVHQGRFEADMEGQRPDFGWVDETKIMPAVMESEILAGDNTANYQQRAIDIVHRYLMAGYPPNPAYKPPIQPYIVWFCKTLQNWKALVGVPFYDGKYYELTYDGENRRTYLDVYQKVENLTIPDSE